MAEGEAVVGAEESSEEEEGPPVDRDDSESKNRRRRHSFEEKLEIIEFAKINGQRKASTKFKVDRKCVRNWLKKENPMRQMQGAAPKRARFDGCGRPHKATGLDDLLMSWIQSQRQKNLRVRRDDILRKAAELFIELKAKGASKSESFSASKGWLQKFMQRQNLSLRRVTTVAQKPPADYLEKLVEFVLYVRKQLKVKGFEESQIFGCDETAVWLDSPGSTTVCATGSKDVVVKTSGHEKLNICVMLTARADGTKLLPFVLLRLKREKPEIIQKFRGKLVLEWAGKIWMDNDITTKYLDKIIGYPYKLAAGKRRLLVWDAFRCHISNSTKAHAAKLKLDMAVVPGGCTKFVQPADVSWNRPFKARIQALHDDWMNSGEKSYTVGGNMRAPDPLIYLQWVVDAWEAVTPEVIRKSFKVCGISCAVDGSDDQQIEFLKKDGCSAGIEQLAAETAALNATNEVVIVEPSVEPVEAYDSDSDVSVELN